MNDFGICNIQDLIKIMPADFDIVEGEPKTIFGLIRVWMMISDPEKVISKVKPKWRLRDAARPILEKYLKQDDVARLYENLNMSVTGRKHFAKKNR